MFRYLPEQASDFAEKVDWVNHLITDISVFFTVAIVGAMIAFAVIYRRRDGKDHDTPQIRGSHFLEIIWTVVPTIICIFVAYYGVVVYLEMREPPPDAFTINVKARQWMWDFEYENGKKTSNEFVVPVNKPVKLVMTSSDVLHSFFVPTMRVKKDVIPGQYTYLWFRPIKTGTYRTYCTEYCGKDHSAMLATLRVVSEDEYSRWLVDRSEELALLKLAPAERGQTIFNQKGCNACHSLDGSPLVGPTFQKLFGRDGKLEDGTSYHADENYIKNSILNPAGQIVQGFPPNLMPAFAGQISDDEITSIIAFIKTLDGSSPAPAAAAAPAPTKEDAAALAAMTPVQRGQKIYQEKLCITCHTLDGAKLVGPTFKGIYGRSGKLADGSEYTADDAYIANSIKNPAAQVVEGYPPAMPPMPLSDDDIKDVIEFMKTLK